MHSRNLAAEGDAVSGISMHYAAKTKMAWLDNAEPKMLREPACLRSRRRNDPDVLNLCVCVCVSERERERERIFFY